MMKLFTFLSLCVVICVMITSSASAQNPAYVEETFSYDDYPYDAESVTDLNGGSGWSGSWILQDGDALTFSVSKGVAEVLGNSKRVFASPLVDSGEEDIWIYTKLKSGTAVDAGYAGISLWNGENEDFFIGQEWNKVVDAVRGGGWGGPNFTSVIAATDDVVFLIKIETWGPGEDDAVTVWLNPLINGAVPAIENATGTFNFPMPQAYEFLSLRSDQTIYCDFIKIGTDVEKILGLTSSAKQLSNSKLALKNYPNPANGKTTVSYILKDSAPIKIELLNTNGKVIKYFNNLDAQVGIHTLEIDTQDLNPGIYFYKLIQNNCSTTSKMIVLE